MPEPKISIISSGAWTKKISKSMLLVLTGVGAVAISLGVYIFIVLPQRERLKAGNELDTTSLQQTITQREQYLQQLKEFLGTYEAIPQEDVALVSRMLPTGKNIPELLAQVEAIVSQSGANLLNINIAEFDETLAAKVVNEDGQPITRKAPTKPKEYKQLSIQLQVSTSDYRAFKNLLESLQSHVRIMDVESYTFDALSEVQNIMVKTYYLKV